MANPLINFVDDIYYFGCTDDSADELVLYRAPRKNDADVRISYNLDRFLDEIRPHEADVVLGAITNFKAPPPKELKHPYVFMQPVIYEGLFFERESFIHTPVALRRARFIQMWDKNKYTSRRKICTK